jgi:hypothetical protein
MRRHRSGSIAFLMLVLAFGSPAAALAQAKPPASSPPAAATGKSAAPAAPAASGAPAAEPASSQNPQGDAANSSVPPASESPESAPPESSAPQGPVVAPAPAITGSAAINAPSSPAPPPPGASPDAPRSPRPRPLTHRFGFQLGLRTTNITDGGFDPYAESNGFGQASFVGTFTPWRTLPFSVHLVGEYDIGVNDSEARGDKTSLSMHRIALGLEGRYEPISRLYFYARVAPSALHLRGTIDDIPLGAKLAARTWTWGLDTSGGAAIRLGNGGNDADPIVTFWLTVDLGYTFAGEAEMVYHPVEVNDEEGRRFGDVTLPPIRPNGFVTRFAGVVTF